MQIPAELAVGRAGPVVKIYGTSLDFGHVGEGARAVAVVVPATPRMQPQVPAGQCVYVRISDYSDCVNSSRYNDFAAPFAEKVTIPTGKRVLDVAWLQRLELSPVPSFACFVHHSRRIRQWKASATVAHRALRTDA